jgi:hypothetical protein
MGGEKNRLIRGIRNRVFGEEAGMLESMFRAASF